MDLERLPPARVAGILVDQTVRSVGSVGANIAEGFNRSRKRYLNSLDISVGEAAESENWLYKLRDAGFIERQSSNTRIRECIEIQKMLHGLVRSISRASPNT